jgi:hypothetical protein
LMGNTLAAEFQEGVQDDRDLVLGRCRSSLFLFFSLSFLKRGFGCRGPESRVSKCLRASLCRPRRRVLQGTHKA